MSKREVVVKVDRNGVAHECEVHDGLAESVNGEVLTADYINGILRLSSTAKARARSATRLLWLSILLTVLDIALVVWPWLRDVWLVTL